MMDAVTSIAATGMVVTAGRWAEGKNLDIKVVVGGMVLAIGIAMVSSSNEEFGSKFALMILITALLRYVVPITKKMGFSK